MLVQHGLCIGQGWRSPHVGALHLHSVAAGWQGITRRPRLLGHCDDGTVDLAEGGSCINFCTTVCEPAVGSTHSLGLVRGCRHHVHAQHSGGCGSGRPVGGKASRDSSACLGSCSPLTRALVTCLAAWRAASALARRHRGTTRRPAARLASAASLSMLSTRSSTSASEHDAPLGSVGHRPPAATAAAVTDGEPVQAAGVTIDDLPDDILGKIFVSAISEEGSL